MFLPVDFIWSQTILDVDDATPTPDCKGIQKWARLVLEDTALIEEQV
jgi:hypothetical protein